MKIEPNNLYLGDCYELIKDVPDKSVDLVYIDIPYEFVANGRGGCFGVKKRDYHSEYLKVSENPNASRLQKIKSSSASALQELAYGVEHSHQQKAYNKAGFKHNEDVKGGELSLALQPIAQGISPNIYDELCRVMKHIYIYGVAKHKFHS